MRAERTESFLVFAQDLLWRVEESAMVGTALLQGMSNRNKATNLLRRVPSENSGADARGPSREHRLGMEHVPGLADRS
jgi:hypothetical protein